jgi:hypothetical protein
VTSRRRNARVLVSLRPCLAEPRRHSKPPATVSIFRRLHEQVQAVSQPAGTLPIPVPFPGFAGYTVQFAGSNGVNFTRVFSSASDEQGCRKLRGAHPILLFDREGAIYSAPVTAGNTSGTAPTDRTAFLVKRPPTLVKRKRQRQA